MRVSFKHRFEYGLLRGLGGFLGMLPEPVAYRLCAALAFLVFRLARKRRVETLRRIRSIFGDRLSEAEVQRVARKAVRNLLFNVLEMVRQPTLDQAWIDKHTIGFDAELTKLQAERDRGNPVILALGHLGNWDLAGQTIASQGIPGIFLMRNQRNPLINDWINRVRTREGSEVIERSDPQLLRKVTRSLKEGKVLAILIDIRAQQDAYALPFLGGTANVGRGLSVFARMAGATIFPAHIERVGYRQHRWAIGDPIRYDRKANKDEECLRMTTESLAVIEKQILDDPTQYFWFNKRWVLAEEPQRPPTESG